MCYMVLINKLNIVSQFMWFISCCIVSSSLFVRWYALVLPLLRFFNFLLSSGCSFRIKFFYILCIWIICKMVNFTWKFLNWRVWNLRTIVYAANCLRVTLSDVASIWYCLVIKLSSKKWVRESLVLFWLPFFINKLFIILMLRRFKTPIKMAFGC